MGLKDRCPDGYGFGSGKLQIKMGPDGLRTVHQNHHFAPGRVGFEPFEKFLGCAAVIGFEFLREFARDTDVRVGGDFIENFQG